MDEHDLISKTRLKKQMHELQDLGQALSRLSHEQLGRLTLPDELREAVLQVKAMKKHEAIRRQMQYIGKIMRNLDPAPIADQLAALHAPSREKNALFHVAERWRDELVADPEAVIRFAKEFPQAKVDALTVLATEARRERKESLPPRRYRELFHAVNALVQDQAAADARAHGRKPAR